MMPSRSLPAFTLIEVLIVTTIIFFSISTFVSLAARITRARELTIARLEARAEGTQAGMVWRTDVAAAREISLRDGALMIVGADDARVEYALDEERRLIRRAGSANIPDRVLAHEVSALAFEPIGTGWRMKWSIRFDNGITRLEWPASAVGAQLVPVGEAAR